jgi:hypothetical protein
VRKRLSVTASDAVLFHCVTAVRLASTDNKTVSNTASVGSGEPGGILMRTAELVEQLYLTLSTARNCAVPLRPGRATRLRETMRTNKSPTASAWRRHLNDQVRPA